MAELSLNAQHQLKLTDNECGNGTDYGVVLIRDSNMTNFTFGFFLFCDVKMELRILVPPVRLLNTENGQILLDSCHIFMPFAQYDSLKNFHKYIYEIRPNNDSSETIALLYGALDIVYSDSSKSKWKRASSYFVTLADEDKYAAQYSPQEINESHLFSDSLGNSLYEQKYNGDVVGIRYYCSTNKAEYTRFFKGK
jgi:hypothetical protein